MDHTCSIQAVYRTPPKSVVCYRGMRDNVLYQTALKTECVVPAWWMCLGGWCIRHTDCKEENGDRVLSSDTCISPNSGIMTIPWHGNAFYITGPLWEESISHSWISHTKGSNAALCGFLCCYFFFNIGRWFKTPWHSYDITVMDGVVRKTSGYSFDGRNEVLWM